MSGIPAGRLRHRITIQQKVDERDSNGAVIETWQIVAGLESLPAEVAPLSTREFISAQAMQSEVRARIRIRYRDGLTATMRAVHRGRAYDFAGTPFADPDSGLAWLTIPVKEGVPIPDSAMPLGTESGGFIFTE